MQGREDSGFVTTPIVYCLLPADLAPHLHDVLRRHFFGEPRVEVVVERRAADRRRRADRRIATAEDRQPAADRRLIRSFAGRPGPRRLEPRVPAPAWNRLQRRR
jgi:hypothetical protein